jgi:hypothetical protein
MDPVSIVYAIAMLVASYAITALTARRPPDAKPAALTDFEFPQFEEGTPQPVVFGDVWLDDWMVLWYGNFDVEPIKKSLGKKKK